MVYRDSCNFLQSHVFFINYDASKYISVVYLASAFMLTFWSYSGVLRSMMATSPFHTPSSKVEQLVDRKSKLFRPEGERYTFVMYMWIKTVASQCKMLLILDYDIGNCLFITQ